LLFPSFTTAGHIRFNDRLLLIGAGIKICKEALKMPGVKRLYQDSDNSGKGATIWGHHFGYVGLLIGHLKKNFCLPLHAQFHEGIDMIRPSNSPVDIMLISYLKGPKEKRVGTRSGDGPAYMQVAVCGVPKMTLSSVSRM
jgi:hypothetical protein